MEAALAGGFWAVGLGPEERVGAAHAVQVQVQPRLVEDIVGVRPQAMHGKPQVIDGQLGGARPGGVLQPEADPVQFEGVQPGLLVQPLSHGLA